MLRRSLVTIGREAMMLFIVACFALSTVVSLRTQAGMTHGADPFGSGVLCLHGGEAVASSSELQKTGLVGDPAAPADENGRCHTDCALCGGGGPALFGALVGLLPALALATLSPAKPLSGTAWVVVPSVLLPPKQGPPATA